MLLGLYGRIPTNSQSRLLGERFGVVLQLSAQSGPPITTIFVSATFTVYDSTGAAVIGPATPMRQDYRNGSMQLRYMTCTGPGQPITTAGTYTYAFSVKTAGGDVHEYKQTALISSVSP